MWPDGRRGRWTSVALRDVAVEGWTLDGAELSSCTTTGDAIDGFTKTTGRRKRIG